MNTGRRWLALGALAACLWAVTCTAAPTNTRPVTLTGTTLQQHFARLGETLDVAADQLPRSVWSMLDPGMGSLRMTLTLGASTSMRSIGLYGDGICDTEYEIFPPTAGTGWQATLSYDSRDDELLVVRLADATGQWRLTRYYASPQISTFGLYFHPRCKASACYHTEDDENAMSTGSAMTPQSLVFAASDNPGRAWWVAFQETSTTVRGYTFADVIVRLEAGDVQTSAPPSSWGAIKKLFAGS